MRWSHIPLKRKLIFAISGALLISITLSTLLTAFLVRENTVERISESEIPTTLAAVSAQVALEIETRLAVAKTMVANAPVNQWLASGENASLKDDVLDYLQQVKRQESAITTYLVSGISGNYYTPEGVALQLDKNNERDAWFFDLIGSGETLRLEVGIADTTQVPTLFINHRIPGMPVITGLGLEISRLSDFIGEYQLGDEGLVYLVDSSGAVKIHPDKQKSNAAHLNERAELANLIPKLLNKSGTQVFSISEPTPRLIAAQYIESLDWYVIAELPTAELFAPLNDMTLLAVLLNLALVGVFMLIAVWQAALITRPITKASSMLQAISDGEADLTQRLEVTSHDEVGVLSGAFNRFSENMRTLIAQLADTSDQVRDVSAQVQQSAKSSQQNSEDQVESIVLVATAITEMGATVKEIAANAEKTASSSRAAVEQANSGQEVMGHTSAEMGNLNQELVGASDAVENLATGVEQIGSVLNVISGISEQTNLLALNAAIEAARAGEQGRGFAVVADEVRNLASKSQQATEEINSMLENLQSASGLAVAAMRKGGERCNNVVSESSKALAALDTVLLSINEMTDMATQVATATVEQSTVVADLEKHITHINDLAEQTLGASAETAVVSEQQLEAASADLKDIVSNFRY